MVEHASMMLDDKLVNAIRRSTRKPRRYSPTSPTRFGSTAVKSRIRSLRAMDIDARDGIVSQRMGCTRFEACAWRADHSRILPLGPQRTTRHQNGFVSLFRDRSHRRLAAPSCPEYPGISDAPTMSDWDPPFPMDLGRIRKADEEYWDRYRATPKAFLPLRSVRTFGGPVMDPLPGCGPMSLPNSCVPPWIR